MYRVMTDLGHEPRTPSRDRCAGGSGGRCLFSPFQYLNPKHVSEWRKARVFCQFTATSRPGRERDSSVLQTAGKSCCSDSYQSRLPFL